MVLVREASTGAGSSGRHATPALAFLGMDLEKGMDLMMTILIRVRGKTSPHKREKAAYAAFS
jgi:hypothetical protein